MIRFCACNKSPASPLENPKHRDSSKFCKICGGRLPVDGRGAQSGSMLSSVGLELSRIIDPHLNWKTASNGRQRAVRKARTSFTGTNRNKSIDKSQKGSENLTDKDSKSTEDMPVSESEKLGVSILGRRFGDALGSVPIKKRRFLLAQSSSPPHHSPSHSDGLDRLLESRPVPRQDNASDREINSADVKTDLEEVNEKICDAADFSGISILAAAACDSNIGGDIIIAEGSVLKGPSSEEQGILGKSAGLPFLSEGKEDLLAHTSQDLVGKTDMRLEISAPSELPSKESNEVKSDGSCSQEKSVNSVQNVPSKTTEFLSRDVRFHWDLNTVMEDAGESHDDEVLNSDHCAGDPVGEKMGSLEPCQGQVGFGDGKHLSELVDDRVHLGGEQKRFSVSDEFKMDDKPGVSSDNSATDDKERKHCVSLPLGDASVQECGLGFSATGLVDTDKINPSLNKGNSCSVPGSFSSPAEGAIVSAAAVDEKKDEAHSISFSVEVEAETSSSHLVSCENAGVDPATYACELRQETVFAEKTNAASATDQNNCSADCCQVGVQMAQDIRSPQAEKHESLRTDSGAIKTVGQSLAIHLAKKSSYMLADENIKESTVNTGGAILGEDEACCNYADKFKKQYSVGESESIASEMTIVDHKCYLSSDENLNDVKSDFPAHAGSNIAFCNPIGISHGNADAPPPVSALSSQGASKINPDGYAGNTGQVASDNHLDCHYYSDTSPNDADQSFGMEKIEFLGDDDSQYEDGEFRESVTDCWLEDGAEEGETERVDYGSDREMDMEEAVSEFPVSVNLRIDNGALSNTNHDLQYRAQAGKDTLDTVSQSLKNCPISANVLDDGFGKRNVGAVAEKDVRRHIQAKYGSNQLLRDVNDASKSGAGNNTVIGNSGPLKEGDFAKESNSTSFRMKFSGWDQLPGGSQSSGNGVNDSRIISVSRNHDDASLGPSATGESVRRVVGSSMKGDVSSRIEGSHSSEALQRRDRSYVRASRSNDRNDYNARAERETDASRAIGRSRSSLHLRGRGKGDHWVVDSPSHHGNSQHDSSGYYGPASFTRPGSRNAAAAAVAKVESNGFVVAPDGTIVKAGGVGSGGCLARRSVKTSCQSAHPSLIERVSPIDRDRAFGLPPGPGHPREMSPERPIFAGRGRARGYGPRMSSVGHRERQHRLMPDDIMDSPASMHHPVTRRDRSFSPHRRPLHLSRSQSRSPSRSRTRSPHRWASPRGRSDSGMNRGPGLQRRSRSPNFRPDPRLERPRQGFGERIVSYVPSSRNNSSPPHASRWFSGRKNLSGNFRDQEYRRGAGRSPPGRVFSRGQRFDPMDSPERPKPDEYYRPMNSGRFPEFVGFGRGSRHEGTNDSRRGHGNRYEMHHSRRQYDNDGRMRRFRYDVEDGFRAQNPRPRSLEFQRGESPMAFGRGIERQIGDSPQRAKEEKGHFGHDRNGKRNDSFKSFGVGDVGDDMDGRRRRP